jgi:hypothetical protein
MIVHSEAWAAAAAAVCVVRSLELAVHAEVLVHIRRAQEAGESWAAVGQMLGFGPIAADRPGPPGELAYDYAAGLPAVSRGPTLDQDGHKADRARLRADVADWDEEAPG